LRLFLYHSDAWPIRGSASEYIRELVRTDQKAKAKDALEGVLIDALQSGDAMEITPQKWNELRQNIRARAKARKR
jgi:antitoxin ParD1/3/4